MRNFIIKQILWEMTESRSDISNAIDENKIIKKQVIKEFISKLSDPPYGISHELLLSLWRRAETNVKNSSVSCNKQGCSVNVCTLYEKSGYCSKHRPKRITENKISRINTKPKCTFMIKKGKTKTVSCKMSALIGRYCKRHARVLLESGHSFTKEEKIEILSPKSTIVPHQEDVPEQEVVEPITIDDHEDLKTDNVTPPNEQELRDEEELDNRDKEIENDDIENEMKQIGTKDDIGKFIEEQTDTLSAIPKLRCTFQKVTDGVIKRCKKDGFAIFGGLCEHHRNKRRITYSV